MKRFVYFILFVIVGIVILDLLNRVVYSVAFSHVPKYSEVNVRYKYQLNEKHANLIVLGASRAQFNYVPEIFQEKLGFTSYNYGMEGSSIIGQYLCLTKAIELGKVDVVLLDLSNSQLQEGWIVDRISSYNNYYWMNDSVKSAVDEIMGRKSIMLLSSLYQFNSHAHDFLWLYADKRKDINGYVPLPYTGSAIHIPNSSKSEKFVVYPLGEKYLDKICQLCKLNGIKLFICKSPSLLTDQSFDEYLSWYCKYRSVQFINLSNCDAVNRDSRLYKDVTHLNDRGARIFTAELCDSLYTYKM